MKNFISRRELRQGLTGTAGLLVVLVFWIYLSSQYHPFILPSPSETMQALTDLWESGELWKNTAITMRRTVHGYCLALLTGFFFALALKTTWYWQAFFRPLITVIQIIPPIVWVILAVIWFGIADDLTPIFLIFIVTFPLTFINVFSSLDSIDLRLVEMARIYRCSKIQVITGIYLPALVPHLISAISVGISFAWKSTIFAEFIGSSSGVGFALSMANSNLETDKLFAWTLVLVILMMVCEYGILLPLKRRVVRWSS